MAKKNFLISICPSEPRASLDHDRDSLTAEEWQDVVDCQSQGDCEEAVRYVLNKFDVSFLIFDSEIGEYREATDKEKEKTCKAIYFDSDTDFSDSELSEIYLVWEATSEEEFRKYVV